MSKKITVIRVTKTEQEGKFGKFPVVDLAYKTDDDKTKGMKIFGYGPNKEVAIVAGASQQGDILEAEFHQNAKGFWEFASLKNTGEKSVPAGEQASNKGTTSSVGSVGTTRSNWETPEERAARQVMIVRQSSLSTAAGLRPKGSASEVISLAKEFEAFVMGNESPKKQVQQTGEVE